ncbi:hypothetical protein AGR7C_Lc160059 [Agrobacterium deltaense Zutra 3/1]|uniref:Uncharacterized protein n=1 Tax=Agrobacterium deltaense Zutra 3/1 TaxID=1183427 RepID=A0A1S7RGU0_9HYPH|nr:hypothetical protein AGR7C_Lc160059 [Agrobacterium deltaense Zutra 3/1]
MINEGGAVRDEGVEMCRFANMPSQPGKTPRVPSGARRFVVKRDRDFRRDPAANTSMA